MKKTLIVATRRTIPKETAWLVVVCNNGASRERSDRGSGRSGPDPMLSRSSRRASPRLLSEFCSWDHPLAEIDRGWTTTRIGSQRNLISALAASVSRFRVQSEVEKGSRERTAEATNMRRSACLQSSYLARDLRRTASTIPSPSNVCTGPEQDCILPSLYTAIPMGCLLIDCLHFVRRRRPWIFVHLRIECCTYLNSKLINRELR